MIVGLATRQFSFRQETWSTGLDSIGVVSFLKKLKHDSRRFGGAVVNLIGNHEAMNFEKDFRYVHPKELKEYGNKQWEYFFASNSSGIALYLKRECQIVAVIGKTLFAHAGVTPRFARWGEKRMNRVYHAWVEGRRNFETNALMGVDGVVWTRVFDPQISQWAEKKTCKLLAETLSILKLDRMVIGHNPQQKGVPTVLCRQRLYLMDVGISSAYGGQLAALQIDLKANNVTVIVP